MLIVRLKGGLGNQLFQYAFARGLAQAQSQPVYLDTETHFKGDPYKRNFSLSIFKVKIHPLSSNAAKWLQKPTTLLNKAIKKLKKLPFSQHQIINEASTLIQSLQDPAITKNTIFDGYWQSEKFFKSSRKELLEELSLKKGLNEENKTLLAEIKTKTSISIHFRDYEHAKEYHGNCNLEYYKLAVDHLKNKLKKPFTLIAFCEKPDYAIKILNELNTPYTLITNNPLEPEMDLELMKNCTHNIIANSSLSWWGAWLNTNPNKIVIAPKPWFKAENNNKIIPNNWLTFQSFEEVK